MSSTQNNDLSHGSRPLMQGQQQQQQQQGEVLKVKGESAESVNVQSQLATSTIAGPSVQSKSNLSQVVQDLSAVHNASSGWIDQETKRINDAGQLEINRSLANAKSLEEQLTKGAMEKQRLIEEEHKVKLAKMVQELDLTKSAQLKELQDGLQRQIQSALTTTKADISRIETRMNNEKMELMKQAQLRSSKEVDKLSNLVVETQLKPSVTRTVIESNTGVGNVIAIATGGQIATGSATAESINSQRVEAVATAGKLTQETDVRTGDMINRQTGQKVGDGAIVNTMTEVQERHAGQQQQGQQQQHQHIAGIDASGVPSQGQQSHLKGSNPHTNTDNKHIDAAYGKPMTHDSHDPAYNKHTTEPQHHTSLLGKVKNALTGGEPTSTHATSKKH